MKIACPVCGSCSASFAGKHTVVDQSLFRCGDCKMHFVYPHQSYLPTEKHDNEKDGQFNFWGSDEALLLYNRWRDEENSRIIDWIGNEGEFGRALEIGFGEGPLTERIVNRAREYWGIEPDRTSYDRTVKRLGLEDSRVFHIAAEDLSEEDWYKREKGRFDSIVMISVFEHLSSPKGVVQACADLLSVGGKLYLTTPDSTNFRYQLWLRKLFGMEPWSYFHISFFNQSGLEKLFQQCGLRVSSFHEAPLITKASSAYFAELTGSRLVGAAMRTASRLRADGLLRIGTFNYVLEKV